MPEGPRAAPEWLAYVLLFGLSLTLQGYRSFDGDQAYRLPILLHHQAPSLYQDDPFVRAFDAFNPHWGYLALLDAPSRLIGLPATLLVLYAATFAITCVGIRMLAVAAWPEAGRLIGVVAMSLVLLADAGNIGTNHLFEPMLLDRLIGFGFGWVALGLFVGLGNRRAGIGAAALIGLSAMVHPSIGLQLGMLLIAAWAAALLSRWLMLIPSARDGDSPRAGLGLPRRRQAKACPTGRVGGWPLAIAPRAAAVGIVAILLALLPAVILQLPQKGALFEGIDAETFRLLSFHVQGPQHMLPHLWRLLQWLAWGSYVVLAALALFEHGRERSAPRARLATLMTILLVALGAAWVAIEVVGDPRVTIFQPFRMATVVRGLALVLIAEHVRRLWASGTPAGTVRAALLVGGLGGDGAMVVAALTELLWWSGDRARLPRLGAMAAPAVLVLGIAYLHRHDPDGGAVPLLAALAASGLCWVFRRRWSPRWTTGRAARLTLASFAVPVLALLAALAPEGGPESVRSALVARCRFVESPTDDIERLALWCRRHTPTDARFIGPPGPKTFRLWSRRSLAFNRAASPYDGRGLADWASRFADHVDYRGGLASFARDYLDDRHALERRYQQRSDLGRAALAHRQGASYILAAAPEPGSKRTSGGPLELLRVEGRYAVYRVEKCWNTPRYPKARLAEGASRFEGQNVRVSDFLGETCGDSVSPVSRFATK